MCCDDIQSDENPTMLGSIGPHSLLEHQVPVTKKKLKLVYKKVLIRTFNFTSPDVTASLLYEDFPIESLPKDL